MTCGHNENNLIVNSRNTLLNTYVDKSIQTLKSMSRRITANKFISYAIIAVLILLILLLSLVYCDMP